MVAVAAVVAAVVAAPAATFPAAPAPIPNNDLALLAMPSNDPVTLLLMLSNTPFILSASFPNPSVESVFCRFLVPTKSDMLENANPAIAVPIIPNTMRNLPATAITFVCMLKTELNASAFASESFCCTSVVASTPFASFVANLR